MAIMFNRQEAALLADFLAQNQDVFYAYNQENDDTSLHATLLNKLDCLRQQQSDAKESEIQASLAEAQILGFVHGRAGHSLASLIKGMGLQGQEWEWITSRYPVFCYLSDDDLMEIEQTVKTA
ncbi:hypothetical protein [Neisseria zoodegmatis]|uniref:Phage associated protein n=1 Tax=Neisseria zoodegmatis TaxID=326523 RepID=A0AB38DS34_9NEIS|nr:hypothetical protein [Neisseria zoodegmatis]OSI10927.1 hypothetical protein BWD10_03170 [Neisseria zoodegmatis]SNU80163.1 Uncharacterised protein [Neisseria zoodegmatis]